jgi:hypothetical protein
MKVVFKEILYLKRFTLPTSIPDENNIGHPMLDEWSNELG